MCAQYIPSHWFDTAVKIVELITRLFRTQIEKAV